MKVKVNDKVQVMTGKDKGKIGKVTQILPSMKKVVIDGVNTMYKHIKSQKKGEKGQRVEFNGPVAISNVRIICPRCSKPSRIGWQVSGKEKSRVCKKCKEVLD